MRFNVTADDSSIVTPTKFAEQLVATQQQPVVFSVPPSANRMLQTHIQQHWSNQPGAKILRQLLNPTSSSDSRRFLCDPD